MGVDAFCVNNNLTVRIYCSHLLLFTSIHIYYNDHHIILYTTLGSQSMAFEYTEQNHMSIYYWLKTLFLCFGFSVKLEKVSLTFLIVKDELTLFSYKQTAITLSNGVLCLQVNK